MDIPKYNLTNTTFVDGKRLDKMLLTHDTYAEKLDTFAAQAMQSLLLTEVNNSATTEQVCGACYRIAEKMMNARQQFWDSKAQEQENKKQGGSK